MIINYWDCSYQEYNETWDGVEELRYYGCTHKDGEGYCDIDNKWGGEKAECPLAEED